MPHPLKSFLSLAVACCFSATAPAATTTFLELEGELLFERTRTINQILSRHNDTMVTKTSGTPYDQEFWLQPYSSRYSRATSTTDTTITPYARNINGGSIGLKLGSESHLQFVLSADHSNLDIDHRTHVIRSNTYMFGLFGSQFSHVGPITFSPKLFVAYSQNKTLRQMSRSSQLHSKYASYWGLVGFNLQYTLPFSDQTRAKLISNIDYTLQKDTPYQEGSSFAWGDYQASQYNAGLEAELSHTTDGGKTTFYFRGGAEKRKMGSGKNITYNVNNASTVFQMTTTSDTYYSEHLGFQHAFVPSFVLSFDVSLMQSANKIKNAQALLGLNFGF
jgi:hypothetical protein